MPSRIGTRTALILVVVLLLLGIWFWARPKPVSLAPDAPVSDSQVPIAANHKNRPDNSATRVDAHNLLLRKGPNFRVYVRWLTGHMARVHARVNPSFDDPESFYLDIKTGVLRANIGDLANFLNTGLTNSPLKDIKLSGDNETIKLNGTLHKGVPLPIELIGTLSATQDGRVQVHVTKLNVLKIPFKGMLGLFHVSVADLFTKQIDGVEVKANDLFFDTQKLLPPPHIAGHLTNVRIANPDLEEVFGNGEQDVERVEQWRNFLQLRGGSIDFGKLTMNSVDLMMIDISKDMWFDLDLTNYQTQLTNGYTRVTPELGLQIFMPDLRDIPVKKSKPDSSIEWFKNRNIPPPPQIMSGGH